MMQDWLNRIGLTLQFVALFLVTPEIIGQEKVAALADKLWIKPLAVVKKITRHYLLISLALFIALPIIFRDSANQLLQPDVAFLNTFPWNWVYDFLMGLTILGSIRLLDLSLSGINIVIDNVIKSPRSFLPVGAFIFTIGFILLIWATFVHAD